MNNPGDEKSSCPVNGLPPTNRKQEKKPTRHESMLQAMSIVARQSALADTRKGQPVTHTSADYLDSMMTELSHNAVRNMDLPSFCPYYCTRLCIREVHLNEVLQQVHNWIAGTGAERKRRSKMGVPSPLGDLTGSFMVPNYKSKLKLTSGGQLSAEQKQKFEQAARRILVRQQPAMVEESQQGFLLSFGHRDRHQKGRYTHHIISVGESDGIVYVQLYSAQIVEHGVDLLEAPPLPTLIGQLIGHYHSQLVHLPTIHEVSEGDVEKFIDERVFDQERECAFLICTKHAVDIRVLQRSMCHTIDVVLLEDEACARAWSQYAQSRNIGAFDPTQHSYLINWPQGGGCILGICWDSKQMRGEDLESRTQDLARKVNEYASNRVAVDQWIELTYPWQRSVQQMIESLHQGLTQLPVESSTPLVMTPHSMEEHDDIVSTTHRPKSTYKPFEGTEVLHVSSKTYTSYYSTFHVHPERFEHVWQIYELWVRGEREGRPQKTDRKKLGVPPDVSFEQDVDIHILQPLLDLVSRKDRDTWLLEFRHADERDSRRRWVTRVRLLRTSTPEGEQQVTLEHSIEQQLMGGVAPADLGNVPRVLERLADAQCFMGYTPMRSQSCATQDDVRVYVHEIFKRYRPHVCTVVVSAEENGRFPFNLQTLQSKLATHTNVVCLQKEPARQRWSLEMQEAGYAPHKSSCPPGHVRLYYSQELSSSDTNRVEAWHTADFRGSRDKAHASSWLANNIAHLIALRATPSNLRTAIDVFDQRAKQLKRKSSRNERVQQLRQRQARAKDKLQARQLPSASVPSVEVPVAARAHVAPVVGPVAAHASPVRAHTPGSIRLEPKHTTSPAVGHHTQVSPELVRELVAGLKPVLGELVRHSTEQLTQQMQRAQLASTPHVDNQDELNQRLMSMLESIQAHQHQQAMALAELQQQFAHNTQQVNASIEALNTNMRVPEPDATQQVQKLEQRNQDILQQLAAQELRALKLEQDLEDMFELTETENEDVESNLAAAQGKLSEYEQLEQEYDEEIKRLERDKSRLEQDKLGLDKEVAKRDLHIHQLKQKPSFEPLQPEVLRRLLDAHKHRFKLVDSRDCVLQAIQQLYNQSGNPPCVQMFVRALREEKNVFDLNQALNLLERLWGKNSTDRRVHILPSAHKSAEQACDFRDPLAAFDMMFRLCTDYWQHIEGYGCKYAAEQAFTSGEWAAHESDGNRTGDAAWLRTFGYKGTGEAFMEHLRYSNGKGSQDGWRCHFIYDACDKVIVIGHCGKHLNFNKKV